MGISLKAIAKLKMEKERWLVLPYALLYTLKKLNMEGTAGMLSEVS